MVFISLSFKTISFPLQPLSKSTRKHWLSFFKNSLLLYHIFLKFHQNMIIFFNRMSFGNSHQLIIKCLIFSFSVISYLSLIFLPPCFFPLFFIISWDPARCNLPNHQEDQVLNAALPPPWPEPINSLFISSLISQTEGSALIIAKAVFTSNISGIQKKFEWVSNLRNQQFNLQRSYYS